VECRRRSVGQHREGVSHMGRSPDTVVLARALRPIAAVYLRSAKGLTSSARLVLGTIGDAARLVVGMPHAETTFGSCEFRRSVASLQLGGFERARLRARRMMFLAWIRAHMPRVG
jgi:hypothetical protein